MFYKAISFSAFFSGITLLKNLTGIYHNYWTVFFAAVFGLIFGAAIHGVGRLIQSRHSRA